MKFTRRFTEEQRIKMVEEVLEYGSNSLVAAKYDIHPGLLSKWKCNYRRYGQTLVPAELRPLKEPIEDYKKHSLKLEKENHELKLEIAVLRDMLKKNNMK